MELLSGSASSALRGLWEAPPQRMNISSTLLEGDDVDMYYSKARWPASSWHWIHPICHHYLSVPAVFSSVSFFSRLSPITSSYTLSQLIAHGLSPTAPVLLSVERYFLKASSFHTLYLIQKITATSYYVLVVHLHLAKHPRSTSEKPKIWTSPLSPS